MISNDDNTNLVAQQFEKNSRGTALFQITMMMMMMMMMISNDDDSHLAPTQF